MYVETCHPTILGVPLIASSTNLIIILVMMQVSKKIPFEDPNVFMGIRALYIVSNLIIVGVYLYVGMQIDKKKGTDAPIDRDGISY